MSNRSQVSIEAKLRAVKQCLALESGQTRKPSN
ncbi:hypothetical protein J2X75_001901 [Paenibacillus sp. 2003]|nr:hypothetical protein [Paenibacillus sp. 2003]